MARAAEKDTIVAVATPPGRGGIGVVRISGPATQALAQSFLGCIPEPRQAHYGAFRDADGQLLDRGIALFFPAPASYTGEDVIELHAHGGDQLLQSIVECALAQGVRLARPGEFTERAFLNDRLDLLQAEAIADLIDSHSRAAVRGALRSLEGEFSRSVQALQEQLTDLRTRLEGWLDFPEEDIDALSPAQWQQPLQQLQDQLEAILVRAQQGQLLRDGMEVVIAGPPNAGKSSLINRLSGEDTAIVTAIPGTTRDVLRARCQIEGLVFQFTDTAGLRHSRDPIEREGIRRTQQALAGADLVLWVDDATAPAAAETAAEWAEGSMAIRIRNKIDLVDEDPYRRQATENWVEIGLSALTGAGMDLLRSELLLASGYNPAAETVFVARARHLQALEQARDNLQACTVQAQRGAGLELMAEELRQAQQRLSELTGEFSADDLLGEIFARFCIGK